MPRITFGFSLKLLTDIPEFGPRIAEIELLLRADAAKYKGAMPEDTVTEAGTGAPRVVAGTIGTKVFNYTPVFQGDLSRKTLREQGFQLLENGRQKYTWCDNGQLEMRELAGDRFVIVQLFSKVTESLYMATTIEDWYDTPVAGEFFVKVVILKD